MLIQEKQRILIVDDERFNLNVLANILRTDYSLILAKNGIQALERALKQPPDLILLDVMMPDMDGYQVMYNLKNNELLKDIPVIFVSALSEVEDEEKGLLLGAVDYITKPFSPAIVRARVGNHMKIVRQRKLLEKFALLDGLTEIPNRRNFMERFSQEWKRAVRNKMPLSLAIVDVDYFKQYNDNYGHSMGDVALKAVASVLSNELKRPADFAARIGGEEFVVLLAESTAKGAHQLAESIRSSVESLQIKHVHSTLNRLTVSIGGATIIPITGYQDHLFECADQMLYRAKGEGKNRVVWQDVSL